MIVAGGLFALFMALIAAICMGLAVSPLVDHNETAVALVRILLIPLVMILGLKLKDLKNR